MRRHIVNGAFWGILFMLKRLFVTGTDTDVGKTVVSRGLMQALAADGRSVAGYKPIAARCQETSEGIRNKDA